MNAMPWPRHKAGLAIMRDVRDQSFTADNYQRSHTSGRYASSAASTTTQGVVIEAGKKQQQEGCVKFAWGLRSAAGSMQLQASP